MAELVPVGRNDCVLLCKNIFVVLNNPNRATIELQVHSRLRSVDRPLYCCAIMFVDVMQ